MRYSVCIIDNEIPAAGAEAQDLGIDDRKLLNASNMQLLLKTETWPDQIIKDLVEKLFEQKDSDGSPKWEVYGITHPSLFTSGLGNNLFRTDLIVFDWDYPATGSGAGFDVKDSLKEILEKTFCLIFIFSKVDKQEEIEAVLKEKEFQEYKHRIVPIDKDSDSEDQVAELIKTAEDMYSENFSFKFAGELRIKSLQIIDKNLSELGRATLNDIKNYLNLQKEDGKRDLIDFIAERFRAGLVLSGIPSLGLNSGTSTTSACSDDKDDKEMIKRIWASRLYIPSDPTIDAADELVRRGDIVEWSDEYYMVVSADCDLRRFWHKNFRSINLLPLYCLHKSNTKLIDILTFCVTTSNLKSGKFKYLTDRVGSLSEGPFILPFLRMGDDYKNFIAMPKAFTGKEIEVHEDISGFSPAQRKNSQLIYKWWDGAKKKCSVSEPFLTAIIQHIFAIIGGYGTPDYPNAMKDIFKGILDEFLEDSTSST